MKLIAHRGNIDGANPKYENAPEYIHHALSLGYDAEVDVWYTVHNEIMLGHDEPDYLISHNYFMSMLQHRGIWWHAKDYRTLDYMLGHGRQIKVFAHETDRYGLVNGGYIWTSDTTIKLEHYNRVVFILPTIPPEIVINPLAYGLCSDNFSGIALQQ